MTWLPNIKRWAQVVAALLRPDGRLFIREAHPVLWSLAENRDELVIEHTYFEQTEPVVTIEPGTYVQTDQQLIHTTSHGWNHGLGEIITALHEAGMSLTALDEHDSIPWAALPGLMTQANNGEWRLTRRPERLPLTYTLQAKRLA